MISVSDQSMALDSMFNEKIISVPVYLIPFINRAPVLNDILDQTYTSDQINQQQVLSIGPVSDGNDGSQKLSLRISSTLPGVATITTLGSSILNITPKTNGTTIVTVTLKDDGLSVGGGVNSITKTFKIVVGTGIYSMEDNSDPFVIYPNPTRGIFTIGNALNTELSIVNTDGTVIEKRKCISEAEQFNISEAANGMYLIQMSINNKCITKKVFLAK